MRRKRRRRIGSKMTVIYISIIVALGATGVGYAAWSDGLTMEMKITTGNFLNAFKVNDKDLKLENCNSLSMNVVNNSTLEIVGDIYPTFEDDIPIVIENQGTIPAKLTKLSTENSGDISKVNDKSITKNRYTFMSNFSSTNSDINFDTLIEPEDEAVPFTINISAINRETINKDIFKSYSIRSNKIDLSSNDDGEIGRLRNRIRELQNEIRDLEESIRDYEKEEDYEFNYELLIEQDL